MKIKRMMFWLLPVLAVAVIGAVVGQKMVAKKQLEATQKAAKAKADDPNTPKFIAAADLVVAGPHRFADLLPITGSIEATQSVVLRAKVGGQVLSASKREGDSVQKGELLATLDSTDLSTRLAEREAVQAQAQVQLDTAQRNLQSQRELFNKGFISQNALDGSEGNVRVLAAALTAAQAGVTLAKQAMSDVRLLAPITGVVGKRHVETGDRLMAEQAIYSLIDKTRLELSALVSTEDASKIKLGQVINSKDFSATVTRFAPQVATGGARAVEMRASITPPIPANLAVGSFVNARISLNARPVEIAIPTTCLRAGNKVWLLKDGRLSESSVQVNARDEVAGMVEIIAGLAAGDQVLNNKIQDLKVGQSITLK
jgi:RND family efflux transporter MFP subunit